VWVDSIVDIVAWSDAGTITALTTVTTASSLMAHLGGEQEWYSQYNMLLPFVVCTASSLPPIKNCICVVLNLL